VSQFEAKVEEWLYRAVPERAINDCFGNSIALATDVGLHRTENQDRVAALRLISSKTNRAPLFAVAVADGMGGMRDGGKCAAIALSSFFATLVHLHSQRLDDLAREALNRANDAVFSFAGGKGGTTLSAILVDATGNAVVVHVGDSRVYSFGHRKKVERWTVDDSLAEVVGGEGRDLLQYAGMGEGIKPHVVMLHNLPDMVALTTDGIHFIETQTLEQILLHATSPRSASERLGALSRWCGGHDNASSALVDIQLAMRDLKTSQEPSVQLCDPFGTMTTIWIRTNGDVVGEDRPKQIPQAKTEVRAPEKGEAVPERPSNVQSANAKSKQNKKNSRTKKAKRNQEDVQLEIEIDQTPRSKKTE